MYMSLYARNSNMEYKPQGCILCVHCDYLKSTCLLYIMIFLITDLDNVGQFHNMHMNKKKKGISLSSTSKIKGIYVNL